MNQTKDILTSLLPLLVLFLIFYFLIIRPQRVQAKKHKEMVEGLQKGDKIVTQGGLICEVIKPEHNFFKVRINDNTEAKLSKNHVAYKLEDQNTTEGN
ncbi:preprotein translocase subunit YajC [Helicobacter heilmannii]|uniref:Sec translocon accessory complex subunit YajC n=1 Tax=Helicobacter heilmannii TaxID=35817 RepID=A0A0K2XDW6_HELHE|nr:preprotein translocase subunit YajC [Helicobacter heilmannii]CCM11338.1 Preprotein translocase subunit YajC (TC 3.A.5.1.1) [Helicobacter heilmannii ASB1.4]CRF45500.1 Preprotein translocase subunit YajC (TC 3.A.5.1.1) [Helicobacter heilmannii]CRF47482.1 Preprotein translocase subunit YajC (TC 3.A.5.1.1) [Helicobacter heilmannii]CRF51116.1 Preprotein translocase subunit YajC (TC 3.A.5.1.1) [Helicobacter heilmannii]CRI34758.1 Preprotein translocase subunit YajC (TC 3.A.5.1.1) [Helicobacter hei